MYVFVRITFVYLISASAFNFLLRGDPYFAGFKVLSTATAIPAQLSYAFPAILLALILSWRTSPNFQNYADRVIRAVIMLGICCVFLASFSSFKTLLPHMAGALGLVHFFADPFLADLDTAIHFGVDPWRLVHGLTHGLGLSEFATQAAFVYGWIWMIPAFYLPAIVVLLGEDKDRIRRFIFLYVFSWIVLGNVLALFGLSAGPIYFDRIFDAHRYDELHSSLLAGGLEGSWFGTVQPLLWEAYADNLQSVGSGISAFPSLHLGMATVTALYLKEKGRWLGYVGIVYVASILFVSVWIGYHYAIDGYFSIIVIVAAHAYSRREQAKRAEPAE